MSDAAESADVDGPDWDETVDVLCVGASPGPLAYGILCAAEGLEVLIVESAHLDPDSLDYLGRMTEDLGEPALDAHLPLVHAQPEVPQGRFLETFDGEQLRQWSARCRSSPFGVLLTEVPDLQPMRTDEGESMVVGVVGEMPCDADPPGPALQRWLYDRAEGLFGPADDRLAGLVHHEGRIAGVALQTADGPRLIGAARGLAISVGGNPQSWPPQPELAGRTAEVAVVSRWGGRFAKVELLAP